MTAAVKRFAGRLDLAGLYRDHYDAVYRYLYGRCRQRALAEDLTQDTFERIARWAVAHQWRDRGRAPLALLYTVAGNLLRDYRKSGRCRLDRPRPDFHSDTASLWSAPDPPVDEQVVDRMRRARCRRVLAEQAARLLTDQQRQVLVLGFVDGLHDRAIGARLGLDPDAVKACRYRALQLLRGSDQVRQLAA